MNEPRDMPAVGIDVLPHAADIGVPEAMTEGAAGYDLRAAVKADIVVEPGRLALVPTGLRLEIPVGYEAQVRPRSGLAARAQVGVLNSPGTIDSDYRGEVMVLLANLGSDAFDIRRGERIAQLVIQRVEQAVLVEVDQAAATSRGSGGFGSTGRKSKRHITKSKSRS